MYQQTELEPQVRLWEEQGVWPDLGEWRPAKNGAKEYHPTTEEIAAKCALFRRISDRRGVTTKQLFISKFPLLTTRAS